MCTSLEIKLKAGFFAFLFLLVAVPVAWSVTRNITETQDTATAFIKNSKGNFWEANGSNIQLAIDDLEPEGGTVWLPGGSNFSISSTLVLEKQTALDMGGSVITPSANFDVIEMGEGSQLKNGIINVSSVANFDSAAIKFGGLNETGESSPKVQNMELVSDGLRGKGIYLHTENSSGRIIGTYFDNIKTREFEYAVILNQTAANGSVKGNTFSNIFGHGDKYFITVHEEQGEATGNYFRNAQCNCTDDTEYIIKNNGQGNVFNTVIAYNWDNNGGTRASYNFSEPGVGHGGGDQCFLSLFGGSEDLEFEERDSSTNRYTILDLEKSRLTIGYKTELG